MQTPKVDQAELLRRFAIQDAPRLMLFLGAGASFQAGIPTASDMIWIFKREIYCSETGASKEAFRDLTLERNRRHLQAYIDNKRTLPPDGANAEYSFYFEHTYPDPLSRRHFVRQSMQGSVPSLGHECLAVLLSLGKLDWVWTTNFDDLIERGQRPDAARRLLLVNPESPQHLDTAIAEDLRPILVKLHGDYRYDSLQNTTDELRALDAGLRDQLVKVSNDSGMIVLGYSGRDESIMSALEAAAAHDGFPRGLFWCVRTNETPNDRVAALVEKVVQKHKAGGIVEILEFDDFLFRLYRQCNLKDAAIEGKAQALYEQRRSFPLPTKTTSQNLIKLNAVKVVEYPTTPFRFQTSLKGWQELRQSIAGHPIVAGLHKGYCIAFGNRERIRAAFGDKVTGEIEVSNVSPGDLIHSDSVMMGLFYDMIACSLVNDYGLMRVGRRTFYIPDPALKKKDRVFHHKHKDGELATPVATPQNGIIVNEAISFQLDFHENALWFVVEPQVVITSDGESLAPLEQRKIVANRVMSGRYNSQSHNLLLFWLAYLASVSDPVCFMFPSRSEKDYRFDLDRHYAFSTMT